MRASRRTRGSSALLLALGALTGLAVGVVLADRIGGLDRLLGGIGKPRKPRGLLTAGGASEVSEDDHDYDEDDDEPMFVAAPGDDDATGVSDDDASESTASEGMTSSHEVPDDTTLEERVLEAFHNDPVLAERAIDIGAIGTGVIELTGWVQSSWEIGHAVTLARGVPDVSTVVDRLAVRDGERRRDHSGRNYPGDTPRDGAEPGATPRAD
jgi:hypothetical protein